MHMGFSLHAYMCRMCRSGALDPLELEIQTVLSCMQVPEIKPASSGEALSASNH